MEMEKAETEVTKRPRERENMLSLEAVREKRKLDWSRLRGRNRETKEGRGFAAASGNFSCLPPDH